MAPRRALSTIDMEPVAKQALLTDLQSFFDQDTKLYYRNNGVPYRRGYLPYGPPDTGKTSLSQAIASEYDLELFFIDLTDMNDSRLQEIFKYLPSRCVVVLEDIDAAGIVREDFMISKTHAGHRRARHGPQTDSDEIGDDGDSDDEDDERDGSKQSKKKTKVTLSGLLNVLDGPGSKEGRLVILTTNAPMHWTRPFTVLAASIK
jgi:chaperone BCS1